MVLSDEERVEQQFEYVVQHGGVKGQVASARGVNFKAAKV